MADLYRVFASTEDGLQLETDLNDPMVKVQLLYRYAEAVEQSRQAEDIEARFVKLEDDEWSELWDYRCAHADLPEIKTYLLEALDYLESISDEAGNLLEPYRTKFKAVDQEALWEAGFFYWPAEDQVRPREFVPQVEAFLQFLDQVIASGSDLLRRTDD